MAKPFLQCHRRFKNGKDHCYWSIAEKVRTNSIRLYNEPTFIYDD